MQCPGTVTSASDFVVVSLLHFLGNLFGVLSERLSQYYLKTWRGVKGAVLAILSILVRKARLRLRNSRC